MRGLIGGLILGLLLDIDFVFGGAIEVESVLLTIIPLVLMLIGLLLGLWAPLGRRRVGAAPVITENPPPI